MSALDTSTFDNSILSGLFGPATKTPTPAATPVASGGTNLTSGNWVQDLTSLLSAGSGIASSILNSTNSNNNVATTNTTATGTNYTNWLIGGGLVLVGVVVVFFMVRK
jgi:hypothetical protein